ncbi:MAG: ComF family protein [Nevskia sp.]|nr:ComF family protein [Nevskia sp.]
MNILHAIREQLLPERCVLCLHVQGPLCAECRAGLPHNRVACPRCARPQTGAASYVCGDCAGRPPPFDAAWSAFRYAAPIDRAVQGLKYSAHFRNARWLGLEMARLLAQRPQPMPQLLLPVPLHGGRLRRRGYNQALELARVIGRALDVTVDTGAMRRLRATTDQIGKTAVERRRNVKNAFAVDAARLQGKHIALLDDVMTTGSTLAELARVCRQAGAGRIEVWTAARVE